MAFNKSLIDTRVRDLRIALINEKSKMEDLIEEKKKDGQDCALDISRFNDLEEFLNSFNALDFQLID